jgi:hypothetical protein
VADKPSRIGKQHTDHRVATSTREERAASHPHDYVNPHDFPEIGRDVPYTEHPHGYPVAKLDCRIEALGKDGLWWVTVCPFCTRDLWYKCCADCSARIKASLMLGLPPTFDRMCVCRRDSWVVFLNCSHHKRWEEPTVLNPIDPRQIPVLHVPPPT